MSTNPATTAPATAVVVMGVSGSGKSTIARRLADALGYGFLDGDDLHPAANVAKMRAGVPLEDADRLPWLDAIAAWMGSQLAAGRSVVVACSALKRAYRERLRRAGPGVRFVYLAVGHDELARRMRAREHFMPPRLLGSQLATLEEPDSDEPALRVDGNGTVDAVVGRALRGLARMGRPDLRQSGPRTR
ncbi:MAG TPA: gluconokinase [Frateuria sp.]|uniref:gluconokinase n=1 Tax=Frateuria sp. TaxID=2211372 RepID=UPI002D7F72CF|nr:gluconokinase [Frateuria sp.]HET6806174.1 gluconokinase [Frateuria sp.]